jgi:putative phosphonate metabolism protein
LSAPRYAIYFAPGPDSALWRWGCRVLGYDAARATDVEPLVPAGFTREAWLRLTAEPRRYGFHATLKAPFRLKPGFSPDDLVETCRRFAAARDGFTVDGLGVAALGRFVALRVGTRSAPLDRLAAEAVTAFETFRAPLTDAEREKRLKAGLDARQLSYLDAYGYPYVLDEFRFHMTLTGAVEAAHLPQVEAGLAESYRAEARGPMPVDAISLFVQPSPDARFTILGRYAFRAADDGMPRAPGLASAANPRQSRVPSDGATDRA